MLQCTVIRAIKQIEHNMASASSASSESSPSSEYWTKVAEATAVTTTTRLSVSISPPRIERRLFCDKDDVVASVASAPAKAASSHDASIAAEAIWKAAALSKST